MACPRADDRGFSLVEVLTASLVFCVGVVGVLPLMAGALLGTRAARDASMATWLAWQKVEELHHPAGLLDSPGGTLDADTPGYVDYLDQAGRQAEPPSLYTRRWSIAAAGGTVRVVVAVHHAAAPGTPVTIAVVRSGRP